MLQQSEVTDVEEDNMERDALLREAEAQDLIEFGLIPEFIGRLPVIVAFHCLDVDMLVRILIEPRNALVPQFQGLFEMDSVSVQIRSHPGDARRPLNNVVMYLDHKIKNRLTYNSHLTL